MNSLAFFDRNKKINKVPLHLGARREKYAASIANRSMNTSIQSLNTIESGTEYADEYVKKEEKELYEFAQVLRNAPNGQYDDVSLATAASHVTEEAAEELTRIYRSYNFAYHPKANLTIKTVKERIVSTIEAEPVTIIQGPTGCGKTTQVPQFILDNCFEKKEPCNIIVTQPRRIAAISIAQRVCNERQWPLGSLVGYQVGLSRHTSQDTRLVYCTTGVLLHRLITTKHMNDFTHIIIDEVHERDQEMDFLLLIVRKFLRSNSRTVKVILMSATFNVDKFSKYFSSYLGKQLVPAPVIDVTKNNYFDVKDFYLCDLSSLYQGEAPLISLAEPEVSKNMIELSVRLMNVMDAIDAQKDDREENNIARPAILVFLPGIHEIEEMHNVISTKQDTCKWDVVVLHSSITNEEQHRIFESPPEGFRRIILSTNIAESSITVPDIKYVIDFCLTKQLKTDPSTNFNCLELTWASKANCQQRAGRTGRVMDGRVYRLIPKRFYATLPDENPPEILTAPLEMIILRAKVLDLDTPKALLALALDPPDISNMERTILLLREAGGLLTIEGDNFDGELTDLGRVMSQLPIDIHITKMIVLGHVFSVLREAIIIGASMSVKNMFSMPFQRKLEAYNSKLSWAQNTSSDGAAYLHAYNVWMREKANARIKTSRAEVQWAQRNCLQIRVLREIDALIHDITARLTRLGIKETVGMKKVEWEESEKNFVIKIIFAGAFYPQYFTTKSKRDEKENLKQLAGLDPLKTVYLQGWPINQPIMLYAQRFQEEFKECLASNVGQIKIKSDNSSRVYVQFGKADVEESQSVNREPPGEVLHAVYRALKRRHISKHIVIPVLTPEESNVRAEELHIEKTAPVCHFININSTPRGPPQNEIRPVLPGLDVTHVSLIIRRIIDPGHFWISIRNAETSSYFSQISQYIESITNLKNVEIFNKPPTIGTLLLAPYETRDETIFRRAIVQGIIMENKSNIMTQVFFIDFGNGRRVQVNDLRRLPENHPIANIPALAFECTLANVKPSVLNALNGEWSRDAKKFFTNIIKDSEKIDGDIYSVVNSVVSLTLTCVDHSQQKININEQLIKEGFAEYREEHYLSKYNHDLRQQSSDFSPAEKLSHEEMQYNQFYLMDSYVTPPEKENCKMAVNLRGPYSPLEAELDSLTRTGIGKKVRVSDESVNSILLDSTVSNVQERLLVSGFVGQSHTSGNLVLRNTALMPNIPGLTSLLCLIFAPQIELRRNSFKTRYSGALCGLGYDKKTHQSLFPEHDMAIDFDVELTMDDMQNVNRLRHWMSAGIFITTDDMDTSEEIAICQNKVKDILFRIIDKERLPIPNETDLLRFQWCRYPPELFLVPGTVSQIKQNIFKLHHALDLEDKNEAKESMIEHVNELKKIASQSFRESKVKLVNCNLCSKDVFGILQLRTHINSHEHRTKEFQIRRA
ncbi:hypothetical protein PV325_013516 [Microctonus aethiopoides]|nr:hypothetical protein PV325_013516 [Microctonus aethiopoides]